jgi:hypothetical protein
MVGFLAAIAAPIENGASQTPETTSTEAEPPPAPDPVPDPNPNPPSTGGGGESSGSSAGSGGERRSPGSDGTASNTDAVDSSSVTTERVDMDTQRDRRRHERQVDQHDAQAAAAQKPRAARSQLPREGGNAAGLGIVAHGNEATQADYELFLLCLAGALALALMLLAAVPAHVLAGVSPALVERRREIEVVIAAVLWSVLIGLLVARYVAQPG